MDLIAALLVGDLMTINIGRGDLLSNDARGTKESNCTILDCYLNTIPTIGKAIDVGVGLCDREKYLFSQSSSTYTTQLKPGMAVKPGLDLQGIMR